MVDKSYNHMKRGVIIVQIPARNEEKTIGKTIKNIPRRIDDHKVEVLVINDNSTDNTEKVNAERLRNALLSIMSHELRTPVNVIMNNLSLFKLQGSNNEIKEELIQDMQATSSRLKSLVNNIIYLAKLSDPSNKPCPTVTSIDNLIKKEIENLVLHSTGQKKNDDFIEAQIVQPIRAVNIAKVIHGKAKTGTPDLTDLYFQSIAILSEEKGIPLEQRDAGASEKNG